MKSRSYIYLLLVSALLAVTCKKPYSPPVIRADNHFLVVEGVINGGSDSTVILLSRTIKISARNSSNPETGAQVFVENDQNTDYPLKETKPGRYISTPLNIDGNHKYRLKIATA